MKKNGVFYLNLVSFLAATTSLDKPGCCTLLHMLNTLDLTVQTVGMTSHILVLADVIYAATSAFALNAALAWTDADARLQNVRLTERSSNAAWKGEYISSRRLRH